jgi:glycosyltransferase involved in cell wall biosynthesis
MEPLVFVATTFRPNTAPANRWLSFARALSELGVACEFVFLLPDECNSHVPDALPGIRFSYPWEGKERSLLFKIKPARQLLLHHYSCRLVRHLESGSKVVILEMSNVMFHLLKRKDIAVFHERTEHPYAYPYKSFSIDHYVRVTPQLAGLFVISEPLRQYFIAAGVSPEKICLINMTVDTSRFDGLARNAGDPYIAYCGTASNTKDGVDELIKAFALVHRAHPEVKLHIIGRTPAPEEYSGNLELIRELGLSSSVVLTGIVPADKMPSVLKDATVLALDRPDNLQAQYGFPTKLGEYLLTENPVVVTHVGDIPRFLEDGRSALIAPPSCPEAFAAKLIWALENPEAAGRIGKEGAQVARRYFNYLTETRKMLGFLR